MKRIALLPILALPFLFSCTRSTDMPRETSRTDSSFESRTITRDLDSTVLTLTIRPAVTCFTNPDGPCSLYVDMICTLSQPIAAAVRIEIEKMTIVEAKDTTAPSAEPAPEPAIILNLMPYQTRLAFRTGSIYNESPETIRDKYTLKSVTVYKPMD